MGSNITEKLTQPIGRREFLKTTGKGIMGAAASQMIPSTGGIMETQAAKEVVKNVPFDYLDFGNFIKKNAVSVASGPGGESVYTAITQDGKRVEFSEPSYESVTSGGTGLSDYNFRITGDTVGSYTGPDGESEYYSSEMPLYEINYQGQMQDDGGDLGGVDIASDFYATGDPESPELEFNYLDQVGENEAPIEIAKDLDQIRGSILSPEAFKEKTEKNKPKQLEQKTNLPAKKGFNIKGVVQALAKRYPPARVLNILQSMREGLDLYDAINQAVGMPTKEEFRQITDEMQSSEFAHGGTV